jgi:hypothetical protein
MVNRAKWSDFKLIKTETRNPKTHKFKSHSVFSCPYCDKTIRLPTQHVTRYKASKCRRHLLVCVGNAAADDERTRAERRGKAEAAADRKHKRMRLITQTTPSGSWDPELTRSLERTRKLHQFVSTTLDAAATAPEEWKRRSEKISQMIDAVFGELGIMLTHA